MCTNVFPWDTTGRNGPTDIFQHFEAKNNGPNEALKYVQAYVDDLMVITRGTLEDHLAKLKGPQDNARCRTENNTAKSCLCTYKPNN
jgi:hypothetical protein